MVTLSATLPTWVRRDVISKLQMKSTEITSIDVGNDRKNVSLIVQPIHNTLSSFIDLDFVVPQGVQEASSIPKTFIYYDSVMGGVQMEKYLNGLLPEELWENSIIRLYSAAFSDEYKAQVMQDFKEGRVRVLICTDAAGMGCNIPDIEVVVQWKIPATLSSFVQHAGWAVRSPGIKGRAILLVEKSTYNVVLGPLAETLKDKKLTPAAKRKKVQEYAEEHGILRGAANPQGDSKYTRTSPPVDVENEHENVHAFVQTGICRWAILAEVFGNEKPEPTVKCCDLCNPDLLNLTRPGPEPTSSRKKRLKKREEPLPEVVEKLLEWRQTIWDCDFTLRNKIFGSGAVFGTNLMSLLASLGPLSSKQDLLSALDGQQWLWKDRYCDELFDFLSSLSILPIPSKPHGAKCKELELTPDIEVAVEVQK
ncbi:hypothetical protein E1B28_013003 [Marasmius oreades]|uniref:DNA 3'-5' helicase n=1 Tax=Marasmius oreades TaxID=181124 RepID=A0A9P7RNV7_9AGAR|nr:uncharacterized protein E1B28_013003 [Marasmius oreades]KAG7087024.1 hypothetical protein E1B28_013003 [Marasmius oreades]